ncbi:hypothetical protein RRG08_026044 [Elysia crispata]|uniref:Uncharacterized protein n=1 Tax=Elysia crispata TaxID=231223 RepID=A0AAE1D7J7_9GAST|nr:hypothetical protein RRG08_026044 [Elysia crispata]
MIHALELSLFGLDRENSLLDIEVYSRSEPDPDLDTSRPCQKNQMMTIRVIIDHRRQIVHVPFDSPSKEMMTIVHYGRWPVVYQRDGQLKT